MKKLLFILGMWTLATWSYGQQMDNASFENWHIETFWHLNDYFDSALEGYHNISPSTDATQGNYSVRLETVDEGRWNPGNPQVAYFINFDGDSFEGGTPYSVHVDTVVIDYKAGIQRQDTALFLVRFKYQGNVLSDTIVPIDSSMNTNQWQTLVIPTRMAPGAVPDTVMIGAASSNAISELGMEIGSWVMFDNLRFISASGSTPPPPNAGFEDWQQMDIEKPDAFMTTVDETLGTVNRTVEKTTNATAGSYAVRLRTSMSLFGQDTVTGYLTNGNMFAHDNSSGGMHLDQNPVSISYDIHTDIQAGDEAYVNFIFKNTAGQTQFIGRGYSTNTVGFYHEEISLSLSYSFDSLRMNAYSGNIPGSEIILDNIVLGYPAAVDTYVEAQRLVAFPVPASDRLNFRIRMRLASPISIGITDMQGRLIRQRRFNLSAGEHHIGIDLTGLPRGNYLYVLSTPGGRYIHRFQKN